VCLRDGSIRGPNKV